MVMKKLIVFSVVFALVAGAAFAVDLGGQVIGTVNFLEGSNAKDKNEDSYPLGAGASMNRLRLDGSGENDDGTFGGYIRAEASGFAGYAWWKPIDLLKIWIGSNGGDGFFAKEGVTGWMFYQQTSDTGVVKPGNVWGGGYGPVVFRSAFYGGGLDGNNGLYMTVSPVEMVDINIQVPFFNGIDYDADTNPEGSAASIFKRTIAQVDLKLDFGNIALTYVGNDYKLTTTAPDNSDPTNPKPASYSAAVPKLFAYFGLTSVENLGIDVGVGFPLPVKDDDDDDDVTTTRSDPISFGVGAKFTTGSFGIKARVVASFAGSVKVEGDGIDMDPLQDPFLLTADILPFYSVSDNLRIFFSAGLGITGEQKENKDWFPAGLGAKADSVVAWHINPYVEVGGEWGPKFVAGLQIWSDGVEGGSGDGDKALVNWAVPFALMVSF